MRTHFFRHPVAVLIVSVTGFLAFGCAGSPDKESPPPTESAENVENVENVEGADTTASAESVEGVERTDTQIFVGDNIEMNYDPNVIMKRAESFHEKEGYAEAIVEYQHFLDMHRNHVLAPYAQYRLALSHFKMVGTIDLDVTPVKKAREEFVELMTDFPGSQYEAEALTIVRTCDRHLAQHHVFVGKFYYQKEAYMAAAKRFKNVIDLYPRLEEEVVESKLYLSKTYKALGATEWARDWAVALVQHHPRHTLRDEGLQLLTALYEENPDLADLDSVDRNVLISSLVPGNTPPVASQAAHATRPPASSLQSGFRSSSTVTQCQVGSWCGVTEPFPYGTTTPRHSVMPSVTCRPGTWCE